MKDCRQLLLGSFLPFFFHIPLFSSLSCFHLSSQFPHLFFFHNFNKLVSHHVLGTNCVSIKIRPIVISPPEREISSSDSSPVPLVDQADYWYYCLQKKRMAPSELHSFVTLSPKYIIKSAKQPDGTSSCQLIKRYGIPIAKALKLLAMEW